MACTEAERTSAFLDGELDEPAATLAERHIETCPDCQGLVAAAAEASEALRGPAARLKAPPGLHWRIRRALDAEDRPRAPRPAFWWGALSGAGLSALAASLVVAVNLPPAPMALAGALGDAHIHALETGRPFQVASSSHHTVKPWFAGRVPLSPPVGDFATQGFPLVGGRVDRVLGRKAAVVVYGHGLHEIDLFVWQDRGSSLPAPGDTHGYHEVFWTKGDLAFAAVSDVQADELDRFVKLVQAQRE